MGKSYATDGAQRRRTHARFERFDERRAGDTLWQEWQRRNTGIGGRGIGTELIPIPKIGGSAGGGGSSIDSELNRLTGRIKSVLSGALKSGIKH